MTNRRARLMGAMGATAFAVLIGTVAGLAGAVPASHRSASVSVVAGPPRVRLVAGAGRRLAGAGTTVHLAAKPPAGPGAGLGPLPPGWVATPHTVDAGGMSRVYLTVEPAHPTRPIPIILLMHGRGMTPGRVLRMSDLAQQVGPAVLVLPAGWHESWNAGDCCGAAYSAGIDDVGFLRTVLADVVAATPDGQASKVYAVGFSNGGRMAYLLACRLPGVLTGFVAVEAVPVEACTPPRRLDMTIVAQQADPLLTLDTGRPKVVGGFVEPTVAATIARMQAVDGCSHPPAVTSAGLSVERTWACADNTHLRYVWYPSGGHDWRPTAGGTPGATAFVLQMLGRGGAGQLPAGPDTYAVSAPHSVS